MKYILDHSGEFERLKRQNMDPEFDALHDLSQFNFGSPSSILDAGCGSGAMIPEISKAFPFSQITGVDGSADRISVLQKEYSDSLQHRFVQSNLSALPFKDGEFEAVLFRYVLQHINPKDAMLVLKEALRCLKPGGKIFIVDVDGYLETLYPMGPLTRKMLNLVSSNQIVDIQVARKLPTWLNEAGFLETEWKIELVSFQGDAKERELKRTMERMNASQQMLRTLGMSESEFEALKGELHRSLSEPQSVCFLNRFYLSAKKPNGYPLKSIK